jgi:hypothetical protein
VLDELAAVAAAEGDLQQAVDRLAAADRLRAEIGVPVPGAEQADRDRTEARCRAVLGDSFTAATMAGLAGRGMPQAASSSDSASAGPSSVDGRW